MAVVPVKADGVFADGIGGEWAGGLAEHGQRAGFGDGRLADCASSFGALVVAQGAGTGVAQELKAVVAVVSVLPLDIDAAAGGDVNFHRFRINFGISDGRHVSSIARWFRHSQSR